MQVVTLEDGSGPDGQPLFVNFVNTLHWYEGVPIELIGNSADLSAWLRERHLLARDLASTLATLHRLRQHLRAVTEAVARGQPLPAADTDAVRTALAGATGHLAWSDVDGTPAPQLTFMTDAQDDDLIGVRMALSLVTFLESGERHRLKLCANPGCGFAFVDTSTNGTRRWCYMRYCGNRLKARAFRRRSRQPAELSE